MKKRGIALLVTLFLLIGISSLIGLYLKTLNKQELIYKNIVDISEATEIKKILDKYLPEIKTNEDLKLAFLKTYKIEKLSVTLFPLYTKIPINQIQYFPLLDRLVDKDRFLKFFNKIKPFDKYNFEKVKLKYFKDTGDIEVYKIKFYKYLTFEEGKLNLNFANKDILELFNLRDEEISTLDKEELKNILNLLPYSEFEEVIGVKIEMGKTTLQYKYNISNKKIESFDKIVI